MMSRKGPTLYEFQFPAEASQPNDRTTSVMDGEVRTCDGAGPVGEAFVVLRCRHDVFSTRSSDDVGPVLWGETQ